MSSDNRQSERYEMAGAIQRLIGSLNTERRFDQPTARPAEALSTWKNLLASSSSELQDRQGPALAEALQLLLKQASEDKQTTSADNASLPAASAFQGSIASLLQWPQTAGTFVTVSDSQPQHVKPAVYNIATTALESSSQLFLHAAASASSQDAHQADVSSSITDSIVLAANILQIVADALSTAASASPCLFADDSDDVSRHLTAIARSLGPLHRHCHATSPAQDHDIAAAHTLASVSQVPIIIQSLLKLGQLLLKGNAMAFQQLVQTVMHSLSDGQLQCPSEGVDQLALENLLLRLGSRPAAHEQQAAQQASQSRLASDMQQAHTGLEPQGLAWALQAAASADKDIAGVLSLDQALLLHITAGLQLLQASAAVSAPQAASTQVHATSAGKLEQPAGSSSSADSATIQAMFGDMFAEHAEAGEEPAADAAPAEPLQAGRPSALASWQTAYTSAGIVARAHLARIHQGGRPGLTNQQQRAVIYATGLHACLQRPLSSKVADDHAPEAVDGSPIADLAQCMLQVASEDDLGIIVEQTLHVLPARSDAPAITAVLQLGTLALLTNLHQAVACTGMKNLVADMIWSTLHTASAAPTLHTTALAWALNPSRLTALLLAAYSLASDQRAHLAAAALLQLRSLCSSSQPPAAASHPAAEQADDSVGEAGPAGPGLQLPACWHLQRQAAACALLHMAHGLLLPGSGAVPAQLATAVQRILEGSPSRPSLAQCWHAGLSNSPIPSSGLSLLQPDSSHDSIEEALLSTMAPLIPAAGEQPPQVLPTSAWTSTEVWQAAEAQLAASSSKLSDAAPAQPVACIRDALAWLYASWAELLVPSDANTCHHVELLGTAALHGAALGLLQSISPATREALHDAASDESISCDILSAAAAADNISCYSWPVPALQQLAGQSSAVSRPDVAEAQDGSSSSILTLCSQLMYSAEEASLAAHEKDVPDFQQTALEASLAQIRLLQLQAAIPVLQQLQAHDEGVDLTAVVLDALMTQLHACMLLQKQVTRMVLQQLLAGPRSAAFVRCILRLAGDPEELPGVSQHTSQSYVEHMWALGPPDWQMDAIEWPEPKQTNAQGEQLPASARQAAADILTFNSLPWDVGGQRPALPASTRTFAMTVESIDMLCREQHDASGELVASRLVIQPPPRQELWARLADMATSMKQQPGIFVYPMNEIDSVYADAHALAHCTRPQDGNRLAMAAEAGSWLAQQEDSPERHALLEATVRCFEEHCNRHHTPLGTLSILEGWSDAYAISSIKQQHRLLKCLGSVNQGTQARPELLLQSMLKRKSSPLWTPAWQPAAARTASDADKAEAHGMARQLLDILRWIMCSSSPSTPQQGTSMQQPAQPTSLEGTSTSAVAAQDSAHSLEEQHADEAGIKLQALQMLIDATIEHACDTGQAEICLPSSVQQTMLLICQAAVQQGVPGLSLLLTLPSLVACHFAAKDGASVQHAVVFLPIFRFLRSMLEGGPPAPATAEPSPPAAAPAADAVTGHAAAAAQEAAPDNGPDLAIEGSGLLSQSQADLVEDEFDEEEEDYDEEYEEEEEEEHIIEVQEEVMHEQLPGGNALTSDLQAEEALLLDGADEAELFDFERELTEVTDIPEELLHAVAELTGSRGGTAILRRIGEGRQGRTGVTVVTGGQQQGGASAVRYGTGAASGTAGASTASGGLADAAGPDGKAICSYVRSGQSFIEQHWYYCYTCGLHDSKGCCSVCAATCHAGHDLVYSGRSRFFCDCGAATPGCPPCKCQSPVSLPVLSPPPGGATASVDMPVPGTMTAADVFAPTWQWDMANAEYDVLRIALDTASGPVLLKGFPDALAREGAGLLRDWMSAGVPSKRLEAAASGLASIATHCGQALLASAEIVRPSAQEEAPQLSKHLCAAKLSGFGPRPQRGSAASSESQPVKELREAEESGLIQRSAMTASVSLGLLTLAQGSFVGILDVSMFAADAASGAATAAGTELPDLSAAIVARHPTKFQVASLAADLISGRHLAVAGLHELQVWTLDRRGQVLDRMRVTVPGDPVAAIRTASAAFISQVQWLPHEDTWLAVSAMSSIFVYDLSKAAHRPALTISLPDAATLASCTFARCLLNKPSQDVPVQRIALSCIALTHEGQLCTISMPSLHRSHRQEAGESEPVTAEQLQRIEQLLLPNQPEAQEFMSGAVSGLCIKYCHAAEVLFVCLSKPGQAQTCTLISRLTNTDGALSLQGLQLPAPSPAASMPALYSVAEVPLLPLARHSVDECALFLGTCGGTNVAPFLFSMPGHAHTKTLGAVQSLHAQGDKRGPAVTARIQGVAELPLPADGNTLVALLSASSTLYLYSCPGHPLQSIRKRDGAILAAPEDLHGSSSDDEQTEEAEFGSEAWCGKVLGPRHWAIPTILPPASLCGTDLSTLVADQWDGLRSNQLARRLMAESEPQPLHAAPIAAQDPFRSDFFEASQIITADVHLSGDAVHAGGAETVRASLRTSGGFLQAATPGGCSLHLAPHDVNLVIIGVKAMVGATGVNHAPLTLKLGSQKLQLSSSGQKRWYNVRLTPEQALSQRSGIALVVGPAVHAGQLPRLDTLEVYARPRTDLDIDLMESELATAEHSTNAAGQKDVINVGEACVKLPARCKPPASHVVRTEALMTHALDLLGSLQQKGGSAVPNELQEDCSQTIAALQNLGPDAAQNWLPSSSLLCSCALLQTRIDASLGTRHDEASKQSQQYVEHACSFFATPGGSDHRQLWTSFSALSQVLKLFVWHPEQLPAMLRTVAQQGSLLRSLTAQAPKALQALQAQSGAAGLPPSFLRHIICAVTCLAVHLAASQASADNQEAAGLLAALLISGSWRDCHCVHSMLPHVLAHADLHMERLSNAVMAVAIEHATSDQYEDSLPALQLIAGLACTLKPASSLLPALAVQAITGLSQAVCRDFLHSPDAAVITVADLFEPKALRLMLLAHLADKYGVALESSSKHPSDGKGDSSATTSFPLDKALLPILQEVLQSAMACISSSSDETAAPDSLLAPASGTASGYGELLQSQTGPSMSIFGSDMTGGAAVPMAHAALVLLAQHTWTPGTGNPGLRDTVSAAMGHKALADSKRAGRKIMLGMCGGHSAYHDARSAYELGVGFQRAREAAASAEAQPLDYQAAAALAYAISALHKSVESRPKSAAAFAVGNSIFLPWLLRCSLQWDSTQAALGLETFHMILGCAEASSRSERGLKAHHLAWLFAEPAETDPPRAKDVGNSPLAHLVAGLALSSPAASVRAEACKVMQALCSCLPPAPQHRLAESSSAGSIPTQAAYVEGLLAWLPHLPAYGPAAAEYLTLLQSLLEQKLSKGKRGGHAGDAEHKPPKAKTPEKKHGGLARAVSIPGHALLTALQTVKEQNAVLADHPHAEAYRHMEKLLHSSGHYLDAEPLPLAQSPDTASFFMQRLDGMQSETKYAHDAIMTRLKQPSLVKAFKLLITEPEGARMVRRMTFFYYPHRITELTALRNTRSLWIQALTVDLKPGQREVQQTLDVPVVATALMVQYSALWENLEEAAKEVLHCPRCSHAVVDVHGICRYCRETAFQCRQCRNINYEHLDAFVCNECGHSRFARFEFHITAAPALVYPPVTSAEERGAALIALRSATDAAYQTQDVLSDLVRPLQETLARAADSTSFLEAQQYSDAPPAAGVKRAVTQAAKLYQDQLKPAHEAALHARQLVDGIKLALTRPDSSSRSADLAELGPVKLPAASSSYRSAAFFLERSVPLMTAMCKAAQKGSVQQLLEADAVSELFTSNMKQGPPSARAAARQLLCHLVQQGGKAARVELAGLIRQRVMYSIGQHRALPVSQTLAEEVVLLKELATGAGATDAEAWQEQLRLVFELLLHASAVAPSNPAIAEHVVLPCLSILADNLGPAATASPAAATAAQASPSVEDRLQEDAGPLVSFPEFQQGQGSLAQFLLRRASTAAWSSAGVSRSLRLSFKYARRWRQNILQRQTHSRGKKQPPARPGITGAGTLGTLPMSKLLSTLLLSCSSQKVRRLAVTLLKRLCLPSPHVRFRLLDQLCLLLPDAADAGKAAQDYLSLLQELAADSITASYLAGHGLLQRMTVLMLTLLHHLQAADSGTSLADAGLHGIASQLLPASRSQAAASRRTPDADVTLRQLAVLVGAVLPAHGAAARVARRECLPGLIYLAAGLRGLAVTQTKLTGESGDIVQQLLRVDWLEGSLDARQAFTGAAMTALAALYAASPAAAHSLRHIPALVLDQACTAIRPPVVEKVYLLHLEKSSTQEEYVRGHMTQNPYSSVNVGPLMRDVKNHICRQLDLTGIIDDDFGMELLVLGSLVSLNLPVRLVYEGLWRPHYQQQGGAHSPSRYAPAAGPPMRIVFRLQGLDGEATEPIVSTLDDPDASTAAPEEEFRVAAALAHEHCGAPTLQMLTNRLSLPAGATRADATETSQLLRILHHAAQLQVCRAEMLRGNALAALLQRAQAAMASMLHLSPAEGSAQQAADAPPAQGMGSDDVLLLLGMIELLVADVNRTAASQASLVLDLSVKWLAEALKAAESQGMPQIAGAIARVLPHLAHSSPTAQAALLDHFVLSLDLSALDVAGASASEIQDQERDLQSFLRLAESVEAAQTTADTLDFRALVLDRSIPQRITAHLLSRFSAPLPKHSSATAEPGAPGTAADDASSTSSRGETLQSRASAAVLMQQRSSGAVFSALLEEMPLLDPADEQWRAAAQKRGASMGLQLLAALVHGHQGIADSLAGVPSLLLLLHQLEEHSPSGLEVGPQAGAILEDIVANGNAAAAAAIQDFRAATRSRKQALAAKRRQAVLASMNLGQSAPGGSASWTAAPEGSELARAMAEAAAEEEGQGLPVCMVCKEGYATMPERLLAAYVFCSRLSCAQCPECVPSGTSSSQQVCSTVSHWNLIHVTCHEAARRADASLRVAKREWEGATLRNAGTLTNNLLPVKNRAVSMADFVAAVATYMDNLSVYAARRRSSSGPASSTVSSLAQVASDIALLLRTFAFQRSFSQEAKGGGPESNMRLLLAMIALGRYFASCCAAEELQGQLRMVQNASSNIDPPCPTQGPYILALALLVQSPQEWKMNMQQSLRYLLKDQLASSPQADSAAHESSGARTADQQDYPGQAASALSAADARHQHALPLLAMFGIVATLQHSLKGQGDFDWNTHVQDRLEDLRSLDNIAAEGLSTLHNVLDSASLAEAFCIIGLLPSAAHCMGT